MPRLEHRTTPSPPGSSLLIALLWIALAATSVFANPDEPVLASAEQLISAGDIAGAVEILRQISNDNPGSEEATLARLRAIDLTVDGSSALGRLEQLHQESGHPEVLFAIARYRYAVGAYKTAASEFAEAAKELHGSEKDNAEVWRGLALWAGGEREEALAQLERKARGGTNRADADRARYIAGEIRSRLDDPARSLALVLPLTETVGEFTVPALLLAGRSYRETGEIEKAEVLLTRLVEEFPGSGEASAARSELTSLRSPAVVVDDGWYVQIASFSVEENAHRFAAAKQDAGVGAIHVLREEMGGAQVYPVCIGPFAAEAEARTAAKRLSEEKLDGNVIEVSGGKRLIGEK